MTQSGDGGRLGQSFLFNNPSAYFQTTGLVLLGQSYSPYSFAMWIRPIISITNGTILHVSADTVGTGWCLPMIGFSALGQIIAIGWNGGVMQVTGPVATLGRWTHIAVTYSSSNGLRLYVNAVFIGQTGAYTFSSSGVPMVATLGQSLNGQNLCARGSVMPGNYRGQIDEFAIYSRELTSADVTALANP